MRRLKKLVMVVLVGVLIVTQMTMSVLAGTNNDTDQVEATLTNTNEEDIGTLINPYWSYIAFVSFGTYVTVTKGLQAGRGIVAASVELKNKGAVGCGCRAILYEEKKPGSNEFKQLSTWYEKDVIDPQVAFLSANYAFYNNTRYKTKYVFYAYDAKGNILETATIPMFYDIKY